MAKTELSFCDGKYKVVFDDKPYKLEAYRHDVLWRNLTGDNLVHAMFERIVELEKELSKVNFAFQNTVDSGVVLYKIENPEPRTRKDVKERISLVSDEMDANEEENRCMQSEIDKLYEELETLV